MYIYIYIYLYECINYYCSCFLVLFGCIDVQYLNIGLILNTETTLNQNFLIFILCLDLLKTYCWCYHFDLLIFPISKVYSSFTITVYMCDFTLFSFLLLFYRCVIKCRFQSYIQGYLPEVDAASENSNNKV